MEINSYLKLLIVDQQNSLLQMIKSFLIEGGEAKRISKEQYNKEIEEAENRISNGGFISQEDAEKSSDQW